MSMVSLQGCRTANTTRKTSSLWPNLLAIYPLVILVIADTAVLPVALHCWCC